MRRCPLGKRDLSRTPTILIGERKKQMAARVAPPARHESVAQVLLHRAGSVARRSELLDPSQVESARAWAAGQPFGRSTKLAVAIVPPAVSIAIDHPRARVAGP